MWKCSWLVLYGSELSWDLRPVQWHRAPSLLSSARGIHCTAIFIHKGLSLYFVNEVRWNKGACTGGLGVLAQVCVCPTPNTPNLVWILSYQLSAHWHFGPGQPFPPSSCLETTVSPQPRILFWDTRIPLLPCTPGRGLGMDVGTVRGHESLQPSPALGWQEYSVLGR